MAKYVCNCVVVDNIGKELKNIAEELNTSISEYGSKIESDLANWNGQAKASLLNNINGVYIPVTKDLIQTIDNLGDFIEKFVGDVAGVEGDYAKINI